MRGKPCALRIDRNKGGITPADAGKTISFYISKLGAEDHPRGCGENVQGWAERDLAAGSPPRMRGKQVGAREAGLAQRITPADAGKTSMKPCCIQGSQDHPRGCGENYTQSVVLLLS